MNQKEITAIQSGLSAEFPRESVHWRVQGKPYERNGKYSAMALPYIDARDVMDRLDDVCGPHGWQSEITETQSGRVLCRLGVLCDGQWVWKTDGAGGTQVEAEKGGISDALKRAAVSWGVGRYLYRLDSPWVACLVNVRGDKTYWKEWAEDPWSKVKVKPSYAPDPPAPDPHVPVFDAVKVRDRIKAKIERATVLDELANVWRTEADDLKRLEAEDAFKFGELVKAKDDAKGRLSDADTLADY